MTSGAPIGFGLIGVDSPHAPSFARLFGDGTAGAVEGGTVAAAWKAPAATDFPPSRDRNDAFADELVGLGVPLLDSAEAVAEASDALLVVASDSRTHPTLFERVAPFGKPVYVDTRFAPTSAEAARMLATAERAGCLVLAGSPKRFTPEFRAAAAGGPVERIELTGALPTQPGHPGLHWYGVHLVDLAVAALGPGCRFIDARAERLRLDWGDGRTAELGGPADWQPLTRGRLLGAAQEREFTIVAEEAMLVGLLDAIVAACRTGVPTVPEAEIRDVVAIVEAATSAIADRAVVELPRPR